MREAAVAAIAGQRLILVRSLTIAGASNLNLLPKDNKFSSPARWKRILIKNGFRLEVVTSVVVVVVELDYRLAAH